MTIYNREDSRTVLPQLEKQFNGKIEEVNDKIDYNAEHAQDYEEITIFPHNCTLGAYNCCYKMGKVVYLGLNFQITTAGSSYDFFTGLPKAIHNWGCTANPTGSVNTARFFVTTDGTLRSDGATVTGWLNGSVTYICE
jgi:hypothetical protein